MSHFIKVDARGLLCPEPLLRLRQAARAASAGQRLQLISDDPHAGIDVSVWCQRHGHQLLEERREAELLYLLVELAHSAGSGRVSRPD